MTKKRKQAVYHEQILAQQNAREGSEAAQIEQDQQVAAYLDALKHITNYQPSTGSGAAAAWAAIFCDAAPILQAFNVDFLGDEWLEMVNERGGDPIECAALELFVLACAADCDALTNRLQLAIDHNYANALSDVIGRAASHFQKAGVDSPWRPLPFSPAYCSVEQLAMDLKGLPGWSHASIKRRIADSTLEKREAIGKARYRAVDRAEQAAILCQIRKSRSGHLAEQDEA